MVKQIVMITQMKATVLVSENNIKEVLAVHPNEIYISLVINLVMLFNFAFVTKLLQHSKQCVNR
jgi:hypothetical protein